MDSAAVPPATAARDTTSAAPRPERYWSSVLRRFLRQPLALGAAVVLAAIVVCALGAD